MFRSSIVVQEDFIAQIENDILTHPIHGTFRFLMGDDKSSWFYLLKKNWDMLYIPDATCYSLESRDAAFLELSTSLPYRWYGNTLRNNGRALALGWRKIGFFIWLCIFDQRLSMWTSLVGLSGALILAIFRDFVYFPIFIAWILIVRTIQMTVIAFNGHPVSILTIPIMLYNQWVGSIIKIRAFFFLADQKWSKGKEKQDSSGDHVPIPGFLAKFLPRFLLVTSYTAFIFALLVTEQVLHLPDVHALPPVTVAKEQKLADTKVIRAIEHGVVGDDGKDDSRIINKLIKQAVNGTVIQLPAGQLDLASPITVSRSHISLTGSGREKTVLYSKLKTPAKAVIDVDGAFGKKLGKLSADLPVGGSVIEFADDSVAIAEGDILLLRQPNDDQFFTEIGSRRWRKDKPIIRQSMVMVNKWQGKQLLYLDHASGISFAAKKTMLIKPDLITDVTISDLTIIQEVPGQKIEEVQYRFENLFPQYQVDLLRFNWTARCIVENVSLLQAGKHALVFDNSWGNSANGLTVIGAWNKGKKGNGYVRFARAFKCSLTDSLVKDIRHITIQWSSANNILENILSSVDINIHGGYPHHNYISNIVFTIPPQHKWEPITLAPDDAGWAPPNGPENEVVGIEIAH